jgi:hypothetical protein
VGSLCIGGESGARLEQHGKTLVASSDSVARALKEFPRLVGSRLIEVEVRPPGGDTLFSFDDDLILNCFPAKSREGWSWMIYADGNKLSLGPGSRVTYESGLR